MVWVFDVSQPPYDQSDSDTKYTNHIQVQTFNIDTVSTNTKSWISDMNMGWISISYISDSIFVQLQIREKEIVIYFRIRRLYPIRLEPSNIIIIVNIMFLFSLKPYV